MAPPAIPPPIVPTIAPIIGANAKPPVMAARPIPAKAPVPVPKAEPTLEAHLNFDLKETVFSLEFIQLNSVFFSSFVFYLDL